LRNLGEEGSFREKKGSEHVTEKELRIIKGKKRKGEINPEKKHHPRKLGEGRRRSTKGERDAIKRKQDPRRKSTIQKKGKEVAI